MGVGSLFFIGAPPSERRAGCPFEGSGGEIARGCRSRDSEFLRGMLGRDQCAEGCQDGLRPMDSTQVGIPSIGSDHDVKWKRAVFDRSDAGVEVVVEARLLLGHSLTSRSLLGVVQQHRLTESSLGNIVHHNRSCLPPIYGKELYLVPRELLANPSEKVWNLQTADGSPATEEGEYDGAAVECVGGQTQTGPFRWAPVVVLTAGDDRQLEVRHLLADLEPLVVW